MHPIDIHLEQSIRIKHGVCRMQVQWAHGTINTRMSNVCSGDYTHCTVHTVHTHGLLWINDNAMNCLYRIEFDRVKNVSYCFIFNISTFVSRNVLMCHVMRSNTFLKNAQLKIIITPFIYDLTWEPSKSIC